MSTRLTVVKILVGFLLTISGVRALASAPPGQYTISNGTVRDNKTGLTWQQAGSTSTYSWGAAQSYCSSLNLSGGGWRLPTVKELQTLVDDSVASGTTIDSVAFPLTEREFYWTSTPEVGNSFYAWCVYFTVGSAGTCYISNGYFVRCVR